MTDADLHDFFVAAASVAGALIGLLFVAISVAQDRLNRPGRGAVHRVRAAAALTAFTNALTVSLLALIPGEQLGDLAIAVGVVGLLFIAASLLSLLRAHGVRWGHLRDITFLVGLLAVFVIQIVDGVGLSSRSRDSGALTSLCTLVVVCFLLGISRAWELIGGPTITLGKEIGARVGVASPADNEK